jgi:cell fate regulator YaaT (PSP1 superfamily)
VLRIATVEDLNQQARIDQTRPQMTRHAKALVERMKLPMKLVDAEPILGGDKITFYFISEERIDFRELVTELAAEHQTRIEMRQVGSRDEARLTADYEKCGQHCCCKQFLKVLKPVSMKNAKIQKATLDPLKISGRCGRLMCCLRYEESTYDDLRARLPKKRTRVSGEFGTGYVIDTQILTQLCLVQLDDKDERIAVALEELTILGPGGGPQGGGGGGGGGSGGAAPQARQDRAPSRDGPRAGGPSADPLEDPAAVDPEHTDEGLTHQHPPVSYGSRPPADAAPGAPTEARPQPQKPDAPPAAPLQSPHGQQTPRRPQWPTGKPGTPQQQSQQHSRRPDRAPTQSQTQGPSRGPTPDAGGPPPRPPQQQPPRPPQQPRPPQPPSRPPEPRDEIDELLGDIETDMGDGHGGPSGNRGPDSGGGQDGGGRKKRRRKRRRGGGGPGGGPGGGGGGGPPPA